MPLTRSVLSIDSRNILHALGALMVKYELLTVRSDSSDVLVTNHHTWLQLFGMELDR